MSETITVHREFVRVSLAPPDILRGRKMSGAGGYYLDFQRKGPEGLSPQPVNPFGHNRQTILKAYAKARQKLAQYVWEHK